VRKENEKGSHVRSVKGGAAGVPSVGGGDGVLRVAQELETFRDDLLVDGKDTVLHTEIRRGFVRQNAKTYAGLGGEVDDRDEFTSVGIDEGLIPLVLLLVLDLDDVGESSRPIGTSEVFERGGMAVVLALQSLFDLGEDLLELEGGLGSSDLGWCRCQHGVLTTRRISDNVQGLTKEEPKETTLSSLKAMLATALAKGMPFYD
jgi:hypothetical protein